MVGRALAWRCNYQKAHYPEQDHYLSDLQFLYGSGAVISTSQVQCPGKMTSWLLTPPTPTLQTGKHSQYLNRYETLITSSCLPEEVIKELSFQSQTGSKRPNPTPFGAADWHLMASPRPSSLVNHSMLTAAPGHALETSILVLVTLIKHLHPFYPEMWALT